MARHNTEDREWWLRYGETLETQFVELLRGIVGIDAMINPAKKDHPTSPDLIVAGNPADVKAQHTPFFTASRYSLDPRYTVTFNRKDYEYYSRCYPAINIYFWVDWRSLSGYGVRIKYLGGIYRSSLTAITDLITGASHEHSYIRRIEDASGNAKSSFLLDIRSMERLFVTEDPDLWGRKG